MDLREYNQIIHPIELGLKNLYPECLQYISKFSTSYYQFIQPDYETMKTLQNENED